MVTRDDVARRAGVSSSTVSYVISGQRAISGATKERVQRAMTELGYTPNAFARALAGAHRGIIAIHYPHGQPGLNALQFSYVSAVAENARRRGYHLLLWSNPIDDVAGLHALLGQSLVDGVLLMDVLPQDPRIPVLAAKNIRFVMLGRPDQTDGLAFVDNDFESAARQAIDHLAGLGHQEVVVLATRDDSRIRQAMVLLARRLGLRVAVDPTAASVRGGHEAFARLVMLDPRPTAAICTNEIVLLGLFHAAAIAGVAIPDQLSVVAIGIDGASAEMLTPQLTTVSPTTGHIVARATDTLADLIEGKVTGVPQLLVTPTLTVRGSSSPIVAAVR